MVVGEKLLLGAIVEKSHTYLKFLKKNFDCSDEFGLQMQFWKLIVKKAKLFI